MFRSVHLDSHLLGEYLGYLTGFLIFTNLFYILILRRIISWNYTMFMSFLLIVYIIVFLLWVLHHKQNPS